MIAKPLEYKGKGWYELLPPHGSPIIVHEVWITTKEDYFWMLLSYVFGASTGWIWIMIFGIFK